MDVHAPPFFLVMQWQLPHNPLRTFWLAKHGRTCSENFFRTSAWSEEEYLVLTEHRGRLVEYTDGFLEVLPMPTDHHQAPPEFSFLRSSISSNPGRRGSLCPLASAGPKRQVS